VNLYEETLYNAILGDIDLKGENFTYTNPLDQDFARYPWHGCPCCIANIPRVLLMLPTWMYATDAKSVYVNLFIGSAVKVGRVGGADLEMVQTTDYPWQGSGSITVNPDKPARFSVKIRVPDHNVSALYTNLPKLGDVTAVSVNGKTIKSRVENGYLVIDRKWNAGDIIEWAFPMAVQRAVADSRIVADQGRVALRYGPLVYSFESADQNLDQALAKDAILTTEWNPDLLGGVLVIKGSFADGKPLIAIPNYARNNRGGRSTVWIKEK
jgi:DUF1680 family protein